LLKNEKEKENTYRPPLPAPARPDVGAMRAAAPPPESSLGCLPPRPPSVLALRRSLPRAGELDRGRSRHQERAGELAAKGSSPRAPGHLIAVATATAMGAHTRGGDLDRGEECRHRELATLKVSHGGGSGSGSARAVREEAGEGKKKMVGSVVHVVSSVWCVRVDRKVDNHRSKVNSTLRA
jgi:hypothetical protein